MAWNIEQLQTTTSIEMQSIQDDVLGFTLGSKVSIKLSEPDTKMNQFLSSKVTLH